MDRQVARVVSARASHGRRDREFKWVSFQLRKSPPAAPRLSTHPRQHQVGRSVRPINLAASTRTDQYRQHRSAACCWVAIGTQPPPSASANAGKKARKWRNIISNKLAPARSVKWLKGKPRANGAAHDPCFRGFVVGSPTANGVCAFRQPSHPSSRLLSALHRRQPARRALRQRGHRGNQHRPRPLPRFQQHP